MFLYQLATYNMSVNSVDFHRDIDVDELNRTIYLLIYSLKSQNLQCENHL